MDRLDNACLSFRIERLIMRKPAAAEFHRGRDDLFVFVFESIV